MDYRLRRIGRELASRLSQLRLDSHSDEDVRDQVAETVHRLAKGHYRGLWELSSLDEKVVLYRLALDGLVSRRAGATIEKLVARDLVRLAPHPTVVNESFRRFVLEAEPAETYENWRREETASTWRRLTLPIMLVLTIALGFLLLTQPTLVDQSLALLATLGAAVPAIARFAPALFERQFR